MTAFRREELAHFGNQLAWLEKTEALQAYADAIRFSSNTRYGLEPATVDQIEHKDADGACEATTIWLTERIGTGRLRIVFGRESVVLASTDWFLQNWQDVLAPSRDDAIIVPESDNWVLFYCHEDEFEFGRRRFA